MSARALEPLQRWFVFIQAMSFFLPDKSALPLCSQCSGSNKAQRLSSLSPQMALSKCTYYSTVFPADFSWAQHSVLGSCIHQNILLKAHRFQKAFDFLGVLHTSGKPNQTKQTVLIWKSYSFHNPRRENLKIVSTLSNYPRSTCQAASVKINSRRKDLLDIPLGPEKHSQCCVATCLDVLRSNGRCTVI